MIILEEDYEKAYYSRTSDYLNLAIEYGEIINKQQDKIIALQKKKKKMYIYIDTFSKENKRLKREIWNLKKTKRRR